MIVVASREDEAILLNTICIGIPVPSLLTIRVDQEAFAISVVTCCRIRFSHEDTDCEGAALSFFLSLVVTSIGIILLVAGSKGQAQIYLTMKQTGAKARV